MFKSLFGDSARVISKSKRVSKRGRKTMSKRQKVLNLLSKGESVSWKALRSRFDLTSPRALVDTLRAKKNINIINNKDIALVLLNNFDVQIENIYMQTNIILRFCHILKKLQDKPDDEKSLQALVEYKKSLGLI